MESAPDHEASPNDLLASGRMVAKPVASPRPTPRGTELDPASVAILKQAIESKDYATRLIAIEAIGDAQAQALLPWLEHALGDPEHDVRMATVEALEKIRSAQALALLATVRDDTSEELDVRALAASVFLAPGMSPARADRGASPLAEPSSSSLPRRDSAPVSQTFDRR
jgi:HEAT repeat protein